MMEGFGSTDGVSYNYGSVEDGYVQNPTFEQRLKKKYWKTKQTVITKLKREEDEHVVAGDADIDVKLEKARHLQTSCQKLLHALASCSYHTQALSSYEVSLSEFLLRSGEHDFTHAGEVMKLVGKAHDRNAKMRMRTVEPVFRLQQEFVTFSNTAIGDLSESIKRLEKARVDYRAALLWMKDVSTRLHNPDARDQLAKFRESQASVKETKIYFEKMKFNLMEKINMVAASRCNLLSHTLPQYQKEMLSYLDFSANELHRVIVTLRSQTQHQYKLNFLMDKEGEFDVPLPVENKEGGEEELGERGNRPIPSDGGSLFGLLQQELSSGGGPGRVGGERRVESGPPISQDEEGLPSPFVSDLLFSTEEETNEGGSGGANGEGGGGGGGQELPSQPRDLLTEEWDEFSTLDSKPLESLTGGGNTDEGTSSSSSIQDWTDDLVEAEQPASAGASKDLMDEINELMACDLNNEKKEKEKKKEENPNDVIFDPLLDNTNQSSVPPPPPPSSSLSNQFDGMSLPSVPSITPLSVLGTPFITASSSALVPPVFPTGTTQTTPNYSLTTGRGATGYKPMMGGASVDGPKESPGQKWANLFAHLDPIANEKA